MSDDEAPKPGHYYSSIDIFGGNVVLGDVFRSIPTASQASEDDESTRALSSANGTNDINAVPVPALRFLLDWRRPLLLTFFISVLGSLAVKGNLIIAQPSITIVLEAISSIYLVVYEHFWIQVLLIAVLRCLCDIDLEGHVDDETMSPFEMVPLVIAVICPGISYGILVSESWRVPY